ncbi:LysE family translocator [Luteolibacter sp. GHJ8]|uniref:LysE family translocator n=1 Tax=Luteolibacter rhizosphaerae TaxID=2989719 RepID=A0ABT3FWX5_9BACT|nr:LysE family translocator [Luteolibacter rhizosphaerae]MCW1912086.1 LysE family translocator [Luteolibacter rhizosphaerae]
MFGIHDFGVFIGACVLLNLTPGPDTLYILGRSMAQGRTAGLASVLGIATGTVVHTLAAALGVSALLAASASAFMVIKFAGAAYLIYLGVRMLVTRGSDAVVPTGFSSKGFGKVFRQGLLTNVLNPKVALFFLAFVPQFISADSPSKFAAFLTLGFTFVGTGTVWCLLLVWASAWIGGRLRENQSFGAWLNRGAGALFVFLGFRLAAAK